MTTQLAMFNPFLPSFLADPYPHYAALRGQDPVHRSLALQVWVVTSFAEAEAVLRDADTYSSDLRVATSPLAQALNQQRNASPLGHVATVLNSDPPTHTRLRGLVNRAFTPRTVEALRARIETVTRELLDAAPSDEPFDLMQALAQPLPVIVIAELLGIPPEDRARFKAWSDAIAATTRPMTPQATIEAARRATTELIAYLEPVIARLRQHPEEDLLSALVQAEDSGDRLTHEELLAFGILLLVAGNETTTNLIGNAVLALSRNPRELDELRRDPSLLPRAIEEVLRWDSPVQTLIRFAKTDGRLGERQIRAGESVLVALGAANRDPARFVDPDRFNIRLERERHLAFGLGPHFCLGAPLARLETEIALGALLARWPSLHLAGEPVRGGTFTLRGLEALPVAV
ncbi:MAG: cytochrome P450 [Dehalococcoidia bacterium]|nr:cytochrome P450 [Dehalococcoidia bacterium]